MAVEWALVVAPFLALVFAIIELSLVYASATLLEGATNHAARAIRTGQLQQALEANSNLDPEQEFRNRMCEYITVMIPCDDVFVEVQRMDSFADFSNFAVQFDEETGDLVSRGVFLGGSDDRVYIRTAYRYNLMVPAINLFLDLITPNAVGSNLAGPDGSILFMSTIVLQSEPYEPTFDDEDLI